MSKHSRATAAPSAVLQPTGQGREGEGSWLGDWVRAWDAFWFTPADPLPLAIVLKPMIFGIEMLGLLIKHGILAVRLLANMVAGHLVLLGIMGLITAAATATLGTWATVTSISVVGSALFSLLELFVAFLQAYIFTFLSALFIGAAVHQH